MGEEFSGDGDDDGFEGSLRRCELFAELHEDRITSAGYEGGEVKCASDTGPSAPDVARPFANTTVAGVGCEASETGEGSAI